MAQFTITAPRPVTRKVAGVSFVDGVATVDSSTDRAALAYFRRHAAYRIEALDGADVDAEQAEPAVEEVVVEPVPQPARNAPTEVWRAYAKSMQMPAGQADAMSRDELVAHFTRGEGE